MRDDQYTRLQVLTEKLTDVVLDEADPSTWPGDGMTTDVWRQLEIVDAKEAQRIRGDRYWSKKNAAATLSLLTKIYTVTGLVERNSAPVVADDEDGDLDKEIKSAEREAERLIKKVQDRAYERTKK